MSEIPFDAGPHVWLSHEGVKPGDAPSTDYVQVLSMGEDGLWVRFTQDPSRAGWKVYFPMDQVISMMMEDHAWPTQ